MARLERRQKMLAHMPKNGVCAEIGVWEGGFSEEVLNITQPKTLHLIDPWLFQPEYGNSAFGRESRKDSLEVQYQAVVETFKDDPRVVIHREMSHPALERFEDGALDWIYIDGNHNFEVVSKDIELSVRKVKPNGVIAGDDLLWKVNDGAPVRRAVRAIKRELEGQHTFQKFGQQWVIYLARDPKSPSADARLAAGA